MAIFAEENRSYDSRTDKNTPQRHAATCGVGVLCCDVEPRGCVLSPERHPGAERQRRAASFRVGNGGAGFCGSCPFCGSVYRQQLHPHSRLLLRGRFALYFIAAVAAIFLVWLYQYEQFMEFLAKIGPPPEGARGPRPHRFHRPLGAMPLFLDFVYDLLVVGMNIATALIFQNYRYRLERQRLSRANAESQLTYLKDQINPHFYMNMLNNIHGMIEIDPEKAQDMVLRMSKLMRYMLYESSKPKIPLSREIEFLRDYLQIMRQRYPESKVKIEAEFPSAAESGSIMVAPLFYLVYIENAFKHGISYQAVSRVSVKISIGGDKVTFDCENTVAADSKADKSGDSHGIGLQNASKRLQLIYGDSFTLTEGEESDEGEENKLYRVSLTIPKQK